MYAQVGGIIRDDVAGTLTTGYPTTLIATPSLIFRHFGQIVSGEASGNFTSGTSVFGSFSDLYDDLEDYDGLPHEWYVFSPVLSPISLSDLAAQFGAEAPCAIFKSASDGKWKGVIYPTGTLGTQQKFLDPAGNPYKWKVGDDFIESSVSAGFTDLDDCANEVHVSFGLFRPTGSYRFDSWVGPSGSDNGNGTRDQNAASPNNRETYAADSKTVYGIGGVLNISAPTITSYEQAFRLRNYLFDRLSRPRLLVSFTTGGRALGLEPGMVTYIHNDLQQYLPCPWYPGPRFGTSRSWDQLAFFVQDVSFEFTGGALLHTVNLEEIPV
jgi:hypothetical protein